jgi:hypothetical protein
MGPASRFPHASRCRSSPAWPQGLPDRRHRDRKGQPITTAGSRRLWTTLVRAADTARRLDPQLARSYYLQMVQRGNDHLGARCPVAAHLAERAWTVMDRGTPHGICATDGTPVCSTQATAIIAQRSRVPEEVRRRRRSRKGKAPHQVLQGHAHGARGATRRPSPRRPVSADPPPPSSRPSLTLDNPILHRQSAQYCASPTWTRDEKRPEEGAGGIGGLSSGALRPL